MKLFFLTFCILVTACSPVNFASVQSPSKANDISQSPPTPPPADQPQPTPPPSCSGTIQQTTENLRIMFLVDNSGSTLMTDPNQFYRVQTIQNFLAKYSAKKNFTYSFGFFATDTFVFDVSSQKFVDVSLSTQMPKSVFGGSQDLSNALRQYTQISPDGDTNYALALSRTEAMITQDEIPKTPWNYILIFMSDGAPTDMNYPVDQNLRQIVRSLQAAAHAHQGLLTISTVLFDPSNDPTYPSNITNLFAMADEGKGQFVDTNKISTGSLQIDDIISVPGPACK